MGPNPSRISARIGGARIRILGVDLDALGAKHLGQRGVVPEARDLGREQGRRRGLAPGRIGHLALERPADRVALRRDRLDLARLHLIEEVRAERNLDPRLARVRGHQNSSPVERQQHEHRDPEPAEAMGRERLMLIGRSAAVRRRGDAPAPVVSGHRRRYRIVSAIQHDVGTASKRTASRTQGAPTTLPIGAVARARDPPGPATGLGGRR